MNQDTKSYIEQQLAPHFLQLNYNYFWLKAMLERAESTEITGSTLITGSSHALNGIQENCWKNAINCSMHSQDIYYDYLCARRAIQSSTKKRFDRCFIIMGYYIAYQDLSRSKVSREDIIANVYYPILQDAHNWQNPAHKSLWAGFGDIPEPVKALCEQTSTAILQKQGTYYSELRPRGTLFDLKGCAWAQVPEQDRVAMGRARAADHNRLFDHKESLEENKQILRDYICFLRERDIMPVVVITPFAPEYSRFVLPEMKDGMLELLDAIPEDIHYVDFNDASELFLPSDFMDTDHLSASGAEKVSHILVEIFGE